VVVSITDDQREKRELAHYTASVTAWFNTRLEHDKSLLTLSTAAIGVLIALASKITLTSLALLILYIAALLSFILCLTAVLWIYRQNSKHLENMLKSDAARDRLLSFLDPAALCAFAAGILFSSLLGLAIAVDSFKSQEHQMSVNDKGKTRIPVGDSFNKAINTRPVGSADLLQKSFNGAAKLKPEAAPPQQTTQQQSTPPAAPPPAGGGSTKP
jgi:hypothetical protein